jgi:hemoglobin-like flavoprotein
VQPEAYEIGGQAFLWTLAYVLGDAFTEEVEEAWMITCMLLAEKMQKAAAQPISSLQVHGPTIAGSNAP